MQENMKKCTSSALNLHPCRF